MSEEQQRDEEIEVEGHTARPGESTEPPADADEENEFEAHIQRFSNVRMD